MCISLNKANRIRLIVSSTDISEEAELRLTSMLNETIKNYWVALGESRESNLVPFNKIDHWDHIFHHHLNIWHDTHTWETILYGLETGADYRGEKIKIIRRLKTDLRSPRQSLWFPSQTANYSTHLTQDLTQTKGGPFHLNDDFSYLLYFGRFYKRECFVNNL